ncbi:SDR family oxidoreductase [Comamonas thiooxydans]|uniref:SDR family oxidoreductase n=1 Tax=Comamonas thiooxydans TaxID=363952 RepID=A0AA42TV60_9BURK|nr:SDR family oxidoreductase [Comamonas thiooxydans]MDH1334983.1 SDR family oxidoreductase [Comamonas thiooxydans]MDH1741134.1 SDR family oxidoreductase [Comamonas thiooxydans]MDH1787470.1 SDR family oxidoreductase [Comamonas thiooxydans]
MNSLKDQHFVVTGVATGIGAEIARQLLASGAHVTGFDVMPPAGATFPCHRIDLADLSAISPEVEQLQGTFAGLCNNAGLSPRPGRESQILAVNFFAQRVFTRVMLPKLASGASIVNMASRAGARWRDNIEQVKRLFTIDPAKDLEAFIRDEKIDHVRAYNLSKEAMIVWTIAETEAMTARELRINALCPAAVATGLLDDFAKAFGEQMAKNVARAGRPGKPEEIASIATFLLSPASNWLRGAEISPDGGMGAFSIGDALNLSGLRI